MFDLTRPNTLENLEQWVDICRTYDPNLPILFLGTKIDLIEDIMIDDEYARSFIEQFNLIEYLKVSSKTGENVNIAFESLTMDVLNLKKK